jgi:alkylhydroperoxidase family enzyme
VAREQGLTEAQVDDIRDGYEDSALGERDIVTLRFTDAILHAPARVTPELQDELRRHFTEPQIVELALGVGLFHALSKLLIVLGLEPENMPTTVLPTPGAAPST